MNTRNLVLVTGYFPNQEKMGGSVMYKEGDGDKKKSFYRGKLSVRRGYKSKEGDYKYDFLPFTCFGSNADYIHNYVKDGDIIQVEGELQISENYEDKNGNTVYGQPFIMADSVSIISSKDGAKSESGASTKSSTPAKKANANNPLAKLRNKAK